MLEIEKNRLSCEDALGKEPAFWEPWSPEGLKKKDWKPCQRACVVLNKQTCEIEVKEMDFKCSNPQRDSQSVSVERTRMLRE